MSAVVAKIDPSQLESQVARLAELSLDELKERWLQLKGIPLPKYLRRGLMTLAVSHALREAAIGGLDPATQKRLDILVGQIVPTGEKPPPKPNRIKPGTRLIREWQGRVHEVSVVPGGFVWNGERHASLSAIARLITGTRWNGWVFFGLKQPQPKAGGAPRSALGPRSKRTPRERIGPTPESRTTSASPSEPQLPSPGQVHG